MYYIRLQFIIYYIYYLPQYGADYFEVFIRCCFFRPFKEKTVVFAYLVFT